MTDKRIHELDERTIEHIAAGEVVERPASVVKELVENSLDAEASRVTIAVESGGTESIRVSDDGVGMTETDAKRAAEKHTTSKIGGIDDLEAGVRTLGFRGEALSAIGSVSRMTITTKSRGGRGTEVCIEGGERTHVGRAGCPEGTTVEVTDLFYNVPARRKYLKRESTEFDHIQRVVMGYALANPDVSVTLEHNGRERFSTSGRGDLQSTVMAVYGREVASAMIDIDSDTGSDSDSRSDLDSDSNGFPDGPLTNVTGLVSHPETNRASREYCTTFVNGRYVTARAVREAVVGAYGTQLAPDRYPFAVVFLELDPATVDVNVHPRKLEVRFANEERVKKQVNHAVREALLREGLIRSSAPRGQSAPEQTEITPGETEEETEEMGESKETEETDVERFTSETTAESDERPETADATKEASKNRKAADSTDEKREQTDNNPRSEPERRDRDTTSKSTSETQSGDADDNDDETPTGQNDQNSREHDRKHRIREPTTQTRLNDSDPESVSQFDRLPALRVFGQLHDTYLVCETDDGLVLIDQHAADERVNYERLKRQFAEDVTTQALAEPVRLELTSRETALFEDYADSLAQLGFHASLIEERIAEVRTVPGLLAESVGPPIVRDLLTAFVDGDGASTVEAAADDLLADLACYPSITGNTSLTEGSVVDLLRALDECENPYACPHGRPVIVEINQSELENRFERDYPGHNG